jgi:hypothetical protein
MELDGIPLHPLVNDAAVALVPLAAVMGLVVALLPGWRWLTRWVLLASTVGGLGALLPTWWTGRALAEDRYESVTGVLAERLATHQERANMLLWIFIAYTLVVLVAFVTVPAATRLADGKLDFAGNGATWATRAVPAALVVVGLVALVSVVLTGHAGAQVAFGS